MNFPKPILKKKKVGTPDPETRTATETRNMFIQDADYATAQAATTAGFLSATNPQSGINSILSGGTYQIRRCFGLFDFTTLPGTVSAATIRIKLKSDTTGVPTNLNDVAVEACSNTGTLTTSDFDNIGVFFGHSTNYIVIGGVRYFEIALNAAGIAAINAAAGLYRFVARDYVYDYSLTVPSNDSPSIWGTHMEIDLTF